MESIVRVQKILKFEPIYKEKIWGGRKLENLGRTLPPGRIGESWEISDFGSDLSIVRNGFLKGRTLRDCFHTYKNEIFGSVFLKDDSFPLLVKIIDAEEKLSVQVHPDENYAKSKDPENKGKKECWFILSADEKSEIVCGFSRNLDRIEYETLIQENRAEEPLFHRKVSAGEAYLIEPGTVHAIGPGNLILEVQQSSDSTYRVYDYGRLGDDGKPRALHLNKALDVLNFNKSNGSERLLETEIDKHRKLLTSNDKFRIEKIEFSDTIVIPRMYSLPVFQILAVIKGNMLVENFSLNPGDTILLSAMGLQEGIECTTSTNTEFALIGCGTDWLE